MIRAQDYYPFGMLMPGRIYTSSDQAYRYGFNTQEEVNEIAGKGNHTTAKYWEYDTRLGRRWNMDPKPDPTMSFYSTFRNNPLIHFDSLGDTTFVFNHKGEHITNIPDQLPNEAHFTYDFDEARDFADPENFRKKSIGYITQSTVQQINLIGLETESEGKERGFVLYQDSEGRELKVADVTSWIPIGSRRGTSIEDGGLKEGIRLFAIDNPHLKIITTGHTHPDLSYHGLFSKTIDALTTLQPSRPTGTSLQDYQQMLPSAHPALIGTPKGISIYPSVRFVPNNSSYTGGYIEEPESKGNYYTLLNN